jgi:radical SAM superfamily enzyme YgiQ (UPF0313 family)
MMISGNEDNITTEEVVYLGRTKYVNDKDVPNYGFFTSRNRHFLARKIAIDTDEVMVIKENRIRVGVNYKIFIATRPNIYFRVLWLKKDNEQLSEGISSILISDNEGFGQFDFNVDNHKLILLKVNIEFCDEIGFNIGVRNLIKDIIIPTDINDFMNGISHPFMVVGGRPEKSVKRNNKKPFLLRPNKGKADITLINMSLLYIKSRNTSDYEIHLPLGLMYIISSLEQQKFIVDFIDHQLFPYQYDNVELFNINNIIKCYDNPASVIGFSCMANLLPFTLLVAKAFKEKYPNVIIIFGGIGVCGVEEKILRKFPWIDIIVKGEGENTTTELLNHIHHPSEWNKIKGIFLKNTSNEIIFTGDRDRIVELNALPMPAYHHLHIELYDAFNIITNRGCPYKCTFCSVAPMWGHYTHCRSIDNIISEIRYLYDNYGVKQILFQDEYFYSSEEKIIQFCDALMETGLPITWKCFGRINLVTSFAMKKMKESGCVEIRFGVESTSDFVLSKINKGFRFKEVVDMLNEAVCIFDSVEAFFIWGFPFERKMDFFKNILFMYRFQQCGVTVLPSLLSLLPQTQIYKNYQAGEFLGKLKLIRELIPMIVVTGHEIIDRFNQIPDEYLEYYSFIERNEEIFPGFFLLDFDNTILPKYRMLLKIESL